MNDHSSTTQFATHESKELHRLRSSFSFRFASHIAGAIQKPWKIILLPYTLPRELLFRKPKPLRAGKINPNSIVMVGIDTRGTMWSERAMQLAIELQRFDSDLRISLLTTSDTILKDRVGSLLHYRIPHPRSMDTGRRDWNLTCERLLSTMIHSQKAGKIVILGDYLYSGIRHSANSGPNEIQLHWMNSGSNQIGLEKLKIHCSTSVYEESSENTGIESVLSKSTMQDHLNLRLDQTTLAHLQLTSSGLDLWENALETSLKNNGFGRDIITASHKKYGFLSETIDIPRHIDSFATPGFHFRIIDDQPELIGQINIDRIPSLILRTERELDKVSLKILEELERFGAVIVLRTPNAHSVKDALSILMDSESRKRMIANRVETTSKLAQEISWAASMHSLIFGN